MSDMLSVAEAAYYVERSPRTVQRWIRDGRLRTYVGRLAREDVEEVKHAASVRQRHGGGESKVVFVRETRLMDPSRDAIVQVSKVAEIALRRFEDRTGSRVADGADVRVEVTVRGSEVKVEAFAA